MVKKIRIISAVLLVMMLIFLLADTSWYNNFFLKIGSLNIWGSFTKSFHIIRHLLTL
ncbi:hypothetical protein M5C72_00380 [Companilactobacillus allii]|uniref:hypothetical protein n=1 Tax=Companilactobacillus allii TaxID=1847728 RepID=UPI0012FF6BFF|nr:hypothetical protein [Companilactobacillus allii]USQ68728.1 hypothetical protein M5C72_00380 [Companilactobacillus allii]